MSHLRVQGDPRGPGGPPHHFFSLIPCYGTGGVVPGGAWVREPG
jgi:hypothetical protein